MELDKKTKILIVGLGQMGGGYAQALTDEGYEVGAIARRQETLDFALEHGYVAHGRITVDEEYVSRFDLVVFALYPHIFLQWIEENQKSLKRGAILTDVTGVKGSVVYAVQDMLRPDLEFIGAHPMAGRETSGVENARKDVFVGANYIVTPTDKNTQKAIDICSALGCTMGFRQVSILSPEEHDEMVGFLSQLTHCIAVALMTCKNSEHLVDYTGDSFRDLTRIAKINDVMWSELFALNKKELVSQMDLFLDKFTELRNYINDDKIDEEREMMKLSTARRKLFDK